MVRPTIGSYFSWVRGAESKTRPAFPNDDDDRHSSGITRKLSWQDAATGQKQERHRRLTTSLRAANSEGSVASPIRGLDGMQECFWIADNLQRADRELDTYSKRLEQMRDSAMHIRQELEGLQTLLASLEKRGRAHQEVEVGEAKDRDIREAWHVEMPTEGPPSPIPLQMESALAHSPTEERAFSELPADDDSEVEVTRAQQSSNQKTPFEEPAAQSVQNQEDSAEPSSYTIAPIQTSDLENWVESPQTPHHTLGIWEMFPESPTEAEDDDFQPEATSQAEESSQPDANSQPQQAAQIDPAPSDQAESEASLEKKRQQTSRSSRSNPFITERFPPQHIMQTISEETEHQQTPRSLRPNAVQKRFPLQDGAPPPSRGPRTMHTLAPRRASLKPVIGLNKVSQMTQFWSKMDGAA